MADSRYVTTFPKQKLPISKKGKKWGEECVNGGMNLARLKHNYDLRMTFEEKHSNYNIINGRLDEKEIQKITDPWGLDGQGVIPQLQDYPIIKPKVDLLVGEASKRQFNWTVKVVNPDAVSEKEEMMKSEITQRLLEIAERSQSEDDVKKGVADMQLWAKFEAQDFRERNANMTLRYLYEEQKLNSKFLRGFKDLLIAGEEVFCVDEIAGEPIARKVSPMNLFTLGMGDSSYIEDASVIIEDSYVPVGSVINEFYEYLTPKQIDFLETRKDRDDTNTGLGTLNYNDNEPHWPSGAVVDAEDGYPLETLDLENRAFDSAFDLNGNVRRTRVVWESLRKVGFIEYPDEDGDMQQDMVDENYVADEERGETVEWKWITEWWEGTKLGKDIYVKIQPRPVQFRRMDNKSYSRSGYVGIVYNTDVSRAKSLVGILKPYQILYDEFMYRIKRAFEKFKMPQIDVDFAFIPDKWSPEKWLYHAEEMGYRFKDSFKEANKGLAQGKLVGSAINNTEKMFNPDMGSYIQQHAVMLQHIENQMNLISGVTEQRQGQVSNRETVGGIERSVLQSSHITEEYFKLHDEVKMRVLEALLETAKYAWRGKKSVKAQYILDGVSSEIFEIDGQQFNESEYGIMISDSSRDTQLMETLKELSHALVQRGEAGISTIIDIYMSPGLATMRRKVEMAEDQAKQTEQSRAEQEQKLQQQQIENAAQIEQAKMELDKYKADLAAQVQLDIARMNQGDDETPEEDDGTEREKLNLEKDKAKKEYELKNKELSETIRSNKAKEAIDRQKPKTTSNVKK